MTLSTKTKLLSLALCAAASTSSVALADSTTTTTTTTTTSGDSSSSSTDGGASFVSLGLRGGFATPSGNIQDDLRLKDTSKGAIVVQADLDFRLLSWLHAGVYAGLGFGLIGDEYRKPCNEEEADCSAYTWLAGAQAEIHLLPTNPFNPWVGVNLGVDGVSQAVETQKLDKSVTAWGVHVGASAGLDLQFDHFAVGPYVSGLVGRYGSRSFKGFNPADYERNEDGRIVGRADEHYWLTVGIRGRFGL